MATSSEDRSLWRSLRSPIFVRIHACHFINHSNVKKTHTFSPAESIDLSSCELDAALPPTFSQALQDFHVEHNLIPGTMPPALFDLPSLASLSASSNMFSGTLPSPIHLPKTTVLSLQGKRLTGTLPHVDGNLSLIEVLDLSENPWTLQAIPSTLWNLSTLTVFRLHSASLQGSLPSTIGHLSRLTQLLLYDNHLTGTLPTEFGNLTQLEILDLSENRFHGPIPRELAQLASLKTLVLHDNFLTGQIPFVNASGLEFLNIKDTEVTGTIPSDLCNKVHSEQCEPMNVVVKCVDPCD